MNRKRAVNHRCGNTVLIHQKKFFAFFATFARDPLNLRGPEFAPDLCGHCRSQVGDLVRHRLSDFQRGRRSGRGSVADMDGIPPVHDQKIINQLSIGHQGLRSNAGVRGNQVTFGDLGDKFLEAPHEGLFT
jgi:hypothetical protein